VGVGVYRQTHERMPTQIIYTHLSAHLNHVVDFTVEFVHAVIQG
jgi:hypothetical protein